MIPRGLQLALQKGRQSRQIWRVKDVPAILKTKIGQLVHSHDPFSCARCGREEPRMVATVHDAGQVFECVGVKEALFASAQVLDLAQSITNCLFVCICVSTGKKVCFLSSMRYPACTRKFKCFSFSGLFLCFAAAITVVHVVVGSQFPCRAAGYVAYIGGLMPVIASALVLCLNEHRWLENRSRRAHHGFLFPLCWSQRIAPLRYVD